MTTERRALPDVEAVTVAMVVAPGVYSRNRMFALFAEPEMARARLRATVVRGLFRQLQRSRNLGLSFRFEDREGGVYLHYEVEKLRLVCRIELTHLERSCLVYLASKTDAPLMQATPEDKTRVEEALLRLVPEAAPSAPR
jgi:hypothetical protein